MKINKSMNGASLNIALEGRLDTTTAPELEKELKDSMDAITELTLDFAKLDYISSAGLRVLLSAHKTMSKKGGMKITHVNEVVAEVFLELLDKDVFLAHIHIVHCLQNFHVTATALAYLDKVFDILWE